MNEAPVPATPAVAHDQQPALENPAPKPSSTAPKWETAARERMRAAIKRFNKPPADLVARDANEGDTRLLVTDMLCEGFGFDKYAELTTEYRVKVEFADYGIRLDKDLIAFPEMKRVVLCSENRSNGNPQGLLNETVLRPECLDGKQSILATGISHE